MIRALVDGRESDTVPVSDSAVLRGDGCFEAVRSYGGRLFALRWHLERMERSARALGIEMPARVELERWCSTLTGNDDGVVRVVLTRGSALPGGDRSPRCIVLFHPLPQRISSVRLGTVAAPWHPAGVWWELAGAKTLSYAPNMAAQRSAQACGFDDALLVAPAGTVLECPTSSVAWVIDGVIETPSLDLHVLDSITRRTMIGLAEGRFPVVEGVFDGDRLSEASEVMVMSTIKEICPVTAVDGRSFAPGPVTAELAGRFATAVDAGWGG